jgi:transposase
MFVRAKTVRGVVYLQIVENQRVEGRTRQRVVSSLGRLDQLLASGSIDALTTSLARYSERLAVLGELRSLDVSVLPSRQIAPALVFGRLWRAMGLDEVLRTLLRGRRFEADVEQAVFLTVLHRLMDPGSDRQAARWKDQQGVAGFEGIALHQLYRTMAWLGEELPVPEQDGDPTPLVKRCVKDQVEELLFNRRSDLFTNLDLVFFDTTSISFEGAGGQSLGQRGHSKDHRPDLMQVVVGAVIDSQGRPVCCEIWPGNTADVTTLVPVAKRLQRRFGIARVCVVADRGMVSEQTKAELDRLGFLYILGVRMRSSNRADEALARPGRFQQVVPPRTTSTDPSPLEVKEVRFDDLPGVRHVICRNEEQARKDRHDREAILAALEQALKSGDKSLIGNDGYRKFVAKAAPGKAFAINRAKAKAEERLDGKWILVTNADDQTLTTAEVATRYKQLWMVEDIFRSMKSLLETRPIWHKRDETIRGHVFCSFLALVLRKELQDRLAQAGHADLEWADIINGLRSISECDITTGGKTFTVRTSAAGPAAHAIAAAGVALPPIIRQRMP